MKVFLLLLFESHFNINTLKRLKNTTRSISRKQIQKNHEMWFQLQKQIAPSKSSPIIEEI